MQVPPRTIARPRERLLISIAGVLLAILMTWPLATGLGRLGRTEPNDADGQFSIWNVSWVARTLAVDPLHVFDANIYAPHKRTLAYSEANLLPGAIGMLPYWLTRNPWLTLNLVLLVAFTSAFVGAYLLLLYLTSSRIAAVAGGVIYAFCPYVTSHLSHIQLLFTGGIPLSLYCLQRLADCVEFRLKAEATGGKKEFRLKAETTNDKEFRLKAETTDGKEFRLKAETTGGKKEFRLKAEATGDEREFHPKAEATGDEKAFGLKAETTGEPNGARVPSGPSAVSAFRRNAAGLALGLALAAQALCCAYYGVFAGLIVGYATLVLAGTRGLWTSIAYWRAIAIAAATSLVPMVPVVITVLRVQQETGGLRRTVEDAAKWSARPVDYITSSAHAHAGLLAYSRTFGPYLEVLFPGFMAVGLGAAGIVLALRRGSRDRETALLYGTLGLLAMWASFGPGAGLYRALYHLPMFPFLRAPARLGLVVTLCLVVFAAIAIRALLAAAPPRLRAALGAVAVLAAIADVAVFPLRWPTARPIPPGYDTLRHRTRATIAEFPFYADRASMTLHAQYMLFSTSHWLPMVNGYSDVIPLDFREAAPVLDAFPTREAFDVLARHRVRYIAVHWDMYVDRRDEIRRRLEPYLQNLNALAGDDRMTIYEITNFP